jgi:hypothetical protein
LLCSSTLGISLKINVSSSNTFNNSSHVES